jgi:predicted nucleic acid-binding protein
VLDSSATLAWCFEDEATPAIDKLFEQVAEQGAWVPGLWRLEVGNGLQMGVRRHRLDSSRRDRLLAALAKLVIRSDPETDRYAWTTSMRLAERFGLTLYDASYLELAQRHSLPLATLDRALRRAAEANGTNLFLL